MKKIFSHNFTHNLVKTLKRFPFTILYSVTLTIILIFIISGDEHKNEYLFKVGNTLFVGIIYSILATLISEVYNKYKSIILNVLVLILMFVFYYFFPIDGPEKYIYKNIIIDLVGILAITFVPYLSKNQQNEYWYYNSKILIKILITSIYVGVIIAGVSIAFGIITALIGAKIEPQIYFDFSIVTIGVFGAIYFLSSFPKKFSENLQDFEYPKSIKILVFYILLPLTTLYFVILYIYFVKIILQWHIPTGSVSYMILIFSILGIIALMSIYPVKNSEKHKGVSIFSKYFFWAIIPLIVLLFVSIFIRIKDYGITENRYYVILFAVWLAGISVYMIKNKLKNIKIIPISLLFVVLLTGFGPWSSFNISKKSQIEKLENILVENNLFPVDNESFEYKNIDDSIYYRIYDIAEYIISNHGSEVLSAKFEINFSDMDSTKYGKVDIFMDSLKIKSINRAYSNTYFNIYNDEKIIKLDGYDYYIDNYYSFLNNNNNDSISISFDQESFLFSLTVKNKTLEYNLKTDLKYIIKNKDSKNCKYEIDIPENENLKVKLIISSFSGNIENNEIINFSLTFGILYRYN